MTGEVTIDTIDIWATYGAFLLKGSYDSLMRPAKRKESLKNNWPDQNGIDIDLEDPHYEAREADLVFMISAPGEAEWWTRYNAFFTLFMSAGSRALFVKELSKTFHGYYQDTPTYEQLTTIKSRNVVAAKCSIKFIINSDEVTV